MIYTNFFFEKEGGGGVIKKKEDKFLKDWLLLMLSASLQCSMTLKPGEILVFLVFRVKRLEMHFVVYVPVVFCSLVYFLVSMT